MRSEKKLRIAVITKNIFLFKKIQLDLYGICDVEKRESPRQDGFDLCFFDLDTVDGEPHGITMSKTKKCILPLPFLIGEAKKHVAEIAIHGLTLNTEEKTAILHGVAIRMTDVEFALLSAIYSRHGEYVSRAELLREVWGDSADSGIINVYVHYLREKLEANGEKIIISSRNMGYSIDKKYFTGGVDLA